MLRSSAHLIFVIKASRTLTFEVGADGRSWGPRGPQLCLCLGLGPAPGTAMNQMKGQYCGISEDERDKGNSASSALGDLCFTRSPFF